MITKNALTVIECGYNYNAWNVDCSGAEPVFSSELKLYEHPGAVDFYHKTGVYGAMGLSYEVYNIDFERYRSRYPMPCFGVTREFSDAVCESIQKGNAVLVAGGFCNYAPAVMGGIQRALGEEQKIGVVWMDAHPDCRIAERPPAPKRFVSLTMSMMMGLTMDKFRKEICGLTKPCEGDHIVAGDMRIMDEETAQILSDQGVHWLDATAFRDSAVWTVAINELAEKVDVIFLSVDADILAGEYVPAYFKAVPYGQSLETVKRNVRTVMGTGKVAAFSTFCFDFDNYFQGGPRTSESGAEIVRVGLESWK